MSHPQLSLKFPLETDTDSILAWKQASVTTILLIGIESYTAHFKKCIVTSAEICSGNYTNQRDGKESQDG